MGHFGNFDFGPSRSLLKIHIHALAENRSRNLPVAGLALNPFGYQVGMLLFEVIEKLFQHLYEGDVWFGVHLLPNSCDHGIFTKMESLQVVFQPP